MAAQTVQAVAGAKESMKMVLDAVQKYSADRAEHLVELLVELINSDQGHNELQLKFQVFQMTAKQDLDSLEVLLYESLFYSVQKMRQLVSENHFHRQINMEAITDLCLTSSSMYYVLTKAAAVLENGKLSAEEKMHRIWDDIIDNMKQRDKADTTRRNFAIFLDDWEKNCRLTDAERQQLKQSITSEFEATLSLTGDAMEEFLGNIQRGGVRRDRRLKSSADQSAASASATVDGQPSANADKNKRIQDAILAYIRGELKDEELKRITETEESPEVYMEVRRELLKWVENNRSRVESIKLPKLNKAGIIAEIKRSWAFAKALLMDDKAQTDEHRALLEEVVKAATSVDGSGATPLISVGRLPVDSGCLRLKFVVDKNSSTVCIKEFLDQIAESNEGTVGLPGKPTLNLPSHDDVTFDVTFAGGGGVNREKNLNAFVQRVVGRIRELAELDVRLAMFGDYDVSQDKKLTNPMFNRIYGQGLKADGFLSTTFAPLVYSGETYFCPNGWRRISINVAPSAAEFDRKYAGWHVAYHGTKHELAAAILTSGFVSTPRYYAIDDSFIHLSPSIVYASHPRYAEVYKLRDDSYVQVVLQVRLNPVNVQRKEPGQLPGATPADAQAVDGNFPGNRNLEWLVKLLPGATGVDAFGNVFVIYGIMIRDWSADPRGLPENAWWKLDTTGSN